jgi:AbrB family looped-hinge helix DNA binding protein
MSGVWIMITKIDANGRVQLPLGLRCRLDLEEGDALAVDHLGDGTIILKKISERLQTELAGQIGAEMVRG